MENRRERNRELDLLYLLYGILLNRYIYTTTLKHTEIEFNYRWISKHAGVAVCIDNEVYIDHNEEGAVYDTFLNYITRIQSPRACYSYHTPLIYSHSIYYYDSILNKV